MSRAPLLSLALVCLVARAVNAVALDAACAVSADCTTTNAECSHMISTCDKGTCTCASGYMKVGSACHMEAANGAACDANKYCMYGTTCQTNLCACASGYTYHAATKMCLDDTKKLISQECSAASECLAGTTMSECVADSGATTPKYCRCKEGYLVYNTYMCMIPHLDQACTAVGCTKMMDFSSIFTGAGQVTETCQSSMCKCPPGSAMISVTYASTTYKVCQTTATGTGNDIADGLACTASNKCHSHVCYVCPSSTSKCISDVAPNSAAGMSGLALALLAPFLLLLLK